MSKWQDIITEQKLTKKTERFHPNICLIFLELSSLNFGTVFPTKALFRISFRPIQEWPIESNPNCSVNWLTVQKVKTAKNHQFSIIWLVSIQWPFIKWFLGSGGGEKIPLMMWLLRILTNYDRSVRGKLNPRTERKCLRIVLMLLPSYLRSIFLKTSFSVFFSCCEIRLSRLRNKFCVWCKTLNANC